MDLRPALLASALEYAARGWHVHPLLVGRKEPLWHRWEARATTDTQLITRMWTRAPYNIGVACGPSHLVALDCDVPDDDGPSGVDTLRALAERASEHVTPTLTVRTGSGGYHLIYRAPAGPALRNTARTLGPCLDTRAAGGYVVGLGSKVDGHRYELVGSMTTAVELPGWLLTLLTTPAEPPKAGGRRRGVEVATRLRALSRRGSRAERWASYVLASECAELAAMAEGTGRNNRLNLAAYRAGQLVASGLLQQQVAEDALTEAARACGLGTGKGAYPQEIEKTLASGMTAGLRRPRRMGDGAMRRVGGAA